MKIVRHGAPSLKVGTVTIRLTSAPSLCATAQTVSLRNGNVRRQIHSETFDEIVSRWKKRLAER